MRLCLNLIVKNESARIERCLTSVLPYISRWSITDTGSTDDTPELIKRVLRGIPGELRYKAFTNFADSRNDALDGALRQDCDYVLLLDADMELVAGEPGWHRDLCHDAYLLLQKAGDISYRNVRLLRKGVRARYIGATHEYLAVEGAVWAKDEAWLLDHADGTNRAGKFERDRLLLEQQYRRSLPTDTRTIYYMAQTSRDLGDLGKAAELYRQRAGMTNDEEAWRAQLEYARCLKAENKDGDFVHAALSAYGRRPHRMEPLYDLARHFIDEKQYAPAILFANIGLNMPHPARELGLVDDYVYRWGFRELYSVAACADPVHRPNGKAICDGLALDKTMPEAVRWGARNNYAWYVDTIDRLYPSWRAQQMRLTPPVGYNPMNPSVARAGDKLYAVVRTVSYWIEEDGYRKTGWESPIHSRNFLVEIDPDTLIDTMVKELLPPVDLPPARNTVVTGMEDMRLFYWRGDLWCSATMVEQSEDNLCEIVLARINGTDALDCFRRMASPDQQHEKNWMPIVTGDKLRFLYKCGPETIVVDDYAYQVQSRETTVAVDHFKGSSQLVPFNGDGWVAVIHYTSIRDKHAWVYHRFVVFDHDLRLIGVSPGFTFPCPRQDFRTGYQYVCGLCRHPDEERLIVSFAVDEQEAWLGTARIDEVEQSIRSVS